MPQQIGENKQAEIIEQDVLITEIKEIATRFTRDEILVAIDDRQAKIDALIIEKAEWEAALALLPGQIQTKQ